MKCDNRIYNFIANKFCFLFYHAQQTSQKKIAVEKNFEQFWMSYL